MENSPTSIIITGSNGLVGSALTTYFAARGYQVRAFQRAAGKNINPRIIYNHFNLEDVRDDGFAGAKYLVHCAYQPVVSAEERAGKRESVDLAGIKKIIQIARKHSIKIIFLSTLSAHPGARSYYARHKLYGEKLFDLNTDLILKLGIVLGGSGGLFGRLSSNLKKYKIVPLIGGGRQVTQTISLDDLCRAVESGISKNICGRYIMSHPEPVCTKDLYRAIAQSVGVKPFFISIPWALAYAGALACEFFGINIPFSAENVLGLKDLRAFDSRADVALFDVDLKDYRQSLKLAD